MALMAVSAYTSTKKIPPSCRQTEGNMTRRLSLSCLAILLVIAFGTQTHRSFAQTQAWPDRIVRLVVPFAAGGPTGLAAPLASAPLSENWGRPGVGGNKEDGGTNLRSEPVRPVCP